MAAKESKPYGRFDFDLASAVTEQLIAAFDALPVGPLVKTTLKEIEAEQGVYQLFLKGKLVYVGKAEIPLPKRLEEHRWNLFGRHNVDMKDLGFKGLIIHKNWAPSVHENILIRHYRNQGDSEWNLSGFGNHDPGRKREDTETNENHFDALYPIKKDFVPDGISAGVWNARDLLSQIKVALPFTFRYEAEDSRPAKGSPKYNEISVTIPRDGMTAEELLDQIIRVFPKGWQATFFPGRVILYEENKKYSHATNVIRR